ncbi:acidic mammalian chitinase-like [Diabrotica undecimpunctata]|uniref:acidic mammalian chitinase-like n=1 Tax=Diabrotica undecimpunctata TaxID=50387 RepID=UPI003B633B4D
MQLKELLLSLIVIYTSFEIVSTYKLVCYYGAWAHYRPGKGSYKVEDIGNLPCSHLIYSFIGLSNENTGEVVSLDPHLDNNLNNVKKFTDLKSSNPKLKILVAIGGYKEGSAKYSKVAASASLRRTFIQSALKYVQSNNFDGLDIDWEYPAHRDGAAVDKENFITLLKETKEIFTANGLLLTAAVAAGHSIVALSYDVPRLSKYVDFINLMAYDFHGTWEGVLGHNAPLYASSSDSNKQLNIDAAVSNWINLGADPQKIILGVPMYGRIFTLSDTNNVALGAASSGASTAGPYTQEAGLLAYNEIVEKQSEGGWTYVWDEEQQVPHIYKGNQWISFDDPKSIKKKTLYAKKKGLGGVMVWSLDMDDFQGLSGEKNALLKPIIENLS